MVPISHRSSLSLINRHYVRFTLLKGPSIPPHPHSGHCLNLINHDRRRPDIVWWGLWGFVPFVLYMSNDTLTPQ